MKLTQLLITIVMIAAMTPMTRGQDEDTLPVLKDEKAPQDFAQMWSGFDPRAEPLETEVLKEWEEDDVLLRVVRFRIGVFKGTKAKLAAIFGYPASAANGRGKVPGLLQIHGGGQYADHKACLANAKRGYATLSIAWAGRISAPGYRVTPSEVKLFWDGKTDDPSYRLTTDWGAVDGYHAPGRNVGNQFPSVKPKSWTLDSIESPRNSGWFLCALAARRALTFLERQPEVDANRIGVYGHSMGGKLTVMTSVDGRVKAAAPSCGGISDRDSDSPLFRSTLGDDVSLEQISCPIFFLSPANDFHGRIGDLPAAINEIQSRQWRVTCSPHHNHQDTPEYEVATLLWMDQHLKGSFQVPQTPETTLQLDTSDGTPLFTVRPDPAKPVLSVDVFYTQQGKADERPEDRLDTMHRFWHHAVATNRDGVWTARLPLSHIDRPLWVYANVRYPLDATVSGAGYYYGSYSANSFNLSSLMQVARPEQLTSAGARATLSSSTVIEDFDAGWEKEWFTYRPAEWARTTNKLNSDLWQAPPGARLAISVQSDEPNRLVVMLDTHAAEVQLAGSPSPQQIILRPDSFKNHEGESLSNWSGVRQLKLSPAEHLRPGRGQSGQPRLVGKNWRGAPPKFQYLRWQVSYSFLDLPRGQANEADSAGDYVWTRDHLQIGVRWQPFIGRPQANEYDATRPVIATDSSYAQFWASWAALEPTEAHTDYTENPSPGLQALERAVDACHARGLKVEFVFFHCPGWASESGQSGGFKPKQGLFEGYVQRMATHFKGRVDAWQLSHEANLEGLMQGADIDFVINDILLQGAQTIRKVYDSEPVQPVLVSTTGMSPCEPCQAREGLDGNGAQAVNHFYDLMIAHPQLMQSVDALNLNVSDHGNGYGNMDGKIIPSVWAQYDLVRGKLDAANLRSKSVLSSESWVTWDDADGNTYDINGDGAKNEQDAYQKTLAIIGQCLQRGLNTINLPWSDNSSSWAMGLTKRRDYNGRVRELNPDIVIPANDGGPDVVTRKLSLRGPDESFSLVDGSGNVFTVDHYIHPSDPNHLHYYIWRWYAQLTGGADEVIRHAIADETGNDITVTGPAFTGDERYRACSWNRTRQRFTILIYASGADGQTSATVSIPSTIQTGRHYHNDSSPIDFRGEGFQEGDVYHARIITKDISHNDGSDSEAVYVETAPETVRDGTLTVTVPNMNRFTAIEFVNE
jgi:hypothetical protein